MAQNSVSSTQSANVAMNITNSPISDPLVSVASSEHHTSPTVSAQSYSHRTGKPSRSKSSTISDRLPCQLAFSPTSVGQLLDWLITESLDASQVVKADSSNSVRLTIQHCPLGPAISIYLMLRAIYRQCDRWDLIEMREALKQPAQETQHSGTSADCQTLPVRAKIQQRRRRQRELLTLLANAVERLQHFESILINSIRPLRNSVADPAEEDSFWKIKFHHILCSTVSWLANASQLLHLVTRDVNLAKTFDPDCTDCPMSEEESTTYSAWTLVQDQLTDVVQAAFGFLTEICVSRLDRISIPQLLTRLTMVVNECQLMEVEKQQQQAAELSENGYGWSSDEFISQFIDGEMDAVLQMLTETLNSLQAAHTNPAFVVQLFARLLHRLNARLFNFLLGTDEKMDQPDNQPSPIAGLEHSTHISPFWGRILHRWIREGLCNWAITEGLGVAAECYLQRVSQAAELMLADMSTVESIYNVAVDLVGLNSRQVRALLQGFVGDSPRRPRSESNDPNEGNDATANTHIPEHWIEFVVSGVKLVADRILAEEELAHPLDISGEDEKTWIPRLHEPLDLLLPLLLPEDSYPSDNPVPGDFNEEPVSTDSGICSRPNSAREQRDHTTEDKRSADPLITVESVRQFLNPAINNGWCRLSVRPICDAQRNDSHVPLLCWNVYLQDVHNVNGTSKTLSVDDESSQSPQNRPASKSNCNILRTLNQTDDQSPVSEIRPHPPETIAPTDTGDQDVLTPCPTSDPFQEYIACLCPKHRPVTVVVPKIGQSLGLSIVAAKSEEDGRDLGIYVRAIMPGSGASQAKLVKDPSSNKDCSDMLPVLRTNDHLLSVNGQSVLGLSQEAAAHLVASAGNEVTLTVIHNAGPANTDSVDIDSSCEDAKKSKSTCPECQLCVSFRVNSLEVSTDKKSTRRQLGSSTTRAVLGASLGHEPPPIPSALGPVMHLPQTRSLKALDMGRSEPSSWSDPTRQECNIMSKSVSGHLQSAEPVLPSRHHTLPHPPHKSSVDKPKAPRDTFEFSSDRNNPDFKVDHQQDYTHAASPMLRDTFEAAQSEYSLNASVEPSELSFNPSGSNWRDTERPCHRPKGQSASFDGWLAASRLREFCEKFTSELESQLNESEYWLSHQQNRQSAGVTKDHGVNESTTGDTSSDLVGPSTESSSSIGRRTMESQSEVTSTRRRTPSTPAECTGPRLTESSHRPRVFVPTVSVLPSNSNRPVETPKPRQRKSNQTASAWASRSLGDLATLEQSIASPADHLNRTDWRSKPSLQRRHTTFNTNRFNLGPRPEPPNHCPSNHVQS